MANGSYTKDLQYYKFCAYGFLKNLRFFEPFLILFLRGKGLSFFQIGMLYGIREIATNILEIPTGVVADVLGRRRTMVSSFVAYILSFVVFTLTSSFPLFIVAMLLFSFGEAFRTGTHKAMIFEYLNINGWQDHKVRYYGNTRGWSQIGSAISALIAAALVFYRGDYTAIFIYTAIPYVLDLLIMVSYPKALDGDPARRDETIISRFSHVFRDFLSAFRDVTILRGVASLSVYSGFYKSVKDYLQPVLKTLALSLPILLTLSEDKRSALLIGMVYFILYMLTSLASRKAGSFSERFDNLGKPLNYTVFAGFAIAVAAGITFYLGLPVISVVGLVLLFLVENLRKPVGIAYVSDKLEKNILATALSAQSQLTSLVAAVLSPLIGLAADRFGIGVAIIAIGLVLLITSPFYRIPRTEEPVA